MKKEGEEEEKWNEREARLSRPSKTPEEREERLLENKVKESKIKSEKGKEEMRGNEEV